MKRSAIKRKTQPATRQATQCTYQPRSRAPAVAVAGPVRATVLVPKAAYLRSEQYRRLVAGLPCAHCGIEGHSQAAHSDAAGKGAMIKSSDDTCYPLCADRPGVVGCHSIIGASGRYTKNERRALELQYAAATIAILKPITDKT